MGTEFPRTSKYSYHSQPFFWCLSGELSSQSTTSFTTKAMFYSLLGFPVCEWEPSSQTITFFYQHPMSHLLLGFSDSTGNLVPTHSLLISQLSPRNLVPQEKNYFLMLYCLSDGNSVPQSSLCFGLCDQEMPNLELRTFEVDNYPYEAVLMTLRA